MPRRPKIEVKKLRGGVLGYAYSDGLIEIDPRQSHKEFLDTLLHEGLHLAYPQLTEDDVSRGATFLAGILWGQKYRRTLQ